MSVCVCVCWQQRYICVISRMLQEVGRQHEEMGMKTSLRSYCYERGFISNNKTNELQANFYLFT
jgi:hypothetical protein